MTPDPTPSISAQAREAIERILRFPKGRLHEARANAAEIIQDLLAQQSAQHAEDTQQLRERVAMYEQTAQNHMQTIAVLNEEIAKVRADKGFEHCEVCNSPLSTCGEQNQDGEPSMDCSVCKLREERDPLRAELARTKRLLDIANRDWAEDDSEIKRLAVTVGIKGDSTDGYFRSAVEVVQDLVAELAREKARLDRIEETGAQLWRDRSGKWTCWVKIPGEQYARQPTEPTLRAAIDQALSTQAQGE